jgi:hypothetical protein
MHGIGSPRAGHPRRRPSALAAIHRRLSHGRRSPAPWIPQTPHESDGDLRRLLARRRLTCREHAEIGAFCSTQNLQRLPRLFGDRNLACRRREESAAAAGRQGRGWSWRADCTRRGRGGTLEAAGEAGEGRPSLRRWGCRGWGGPRCRRRGCSGAGRGGFRESGMLEWGLKVSDLCFFPFFSHDWVICSSNTNYTYQDLFASKKKILLIYFCYFTCLNLLLP